VSAPAAPVSVSVWGELRGDRKPPGAAVLRVLVAGQHAGMIGRGEDGAWLAQGGGLRPSQPTSHGTAEEALRAVLRSSWGRKLGARAASHVSWTDRATRLAARKAAPVAAPRTGA